MGRPKVDNKIIAIDDSSVGIISYFKGGYITHIIDKEDLPRALAFHWGTTESRGMIYSTSCIGNHRVSLHRLIMSFPPSMIDHIDGNTLNNRKSNLREVTASQNKINQKSRVDSKVGIKGVSKRGHRYGATLFVHGRNKRLGTFKTKEEAAIAYNEAALKYFGDCARLNIIPDVTYSQAITKTY